MSFTQEFRQKNLKVSNLNKEITSLKQERQRVKESLQEELDRLGQAKAEAEKYLSIKGEALSLLQEADAKMEYANRTYLTANHEANVQLNKIDEERDKLKGEKKDHQRILSEYQQKVLELKEDREDLEVDLGTLIMEFNSEKRNQENYLEKVKEENKHIREEVRKNNKRLSEIYEQYDIVTKELNRKRSDAEEIQQYIDENQDSAKAVINGIIEREHNLATRERDLKIKEARLQALYKKHFPNKQIKV